MKSLYLTSTDLNLIKKYEIGRGTNGSVYRVPYKLFNTQKGTLFKIYHTNIQFIDNDDIKIYHIGDTKKNSYVEKLSYFDNNNVHISFNDAIYKVIDRQSKIKLTDLPKNVIYIDNYFSGYILKEQYGIQIHYLTGLPLLLKYKIMKKLILKIEELINNYIYTIDIDSSPFGKCIYQDLNGNLKYVGHSNILINPLNFNPSIIDLDGKSTIYTDTYNEYYYKQTILKLNILLLEFLFGINLDDFYNSDADLSNNIIESLNKYNIDNYFIDGLSNLSLSINDIKLLLKKRNNPLK